MTRNSDFKAFVRARMAATGETYTRARSHLLSQQPATADDPTEQPREQPREQPTDQPADQPVDPEARAAARFRERTLRSFVLDGRVTAIPVRRRQRVVVLLELMQAFDPTATYREPEVNRILADAVLDPEQADHATLRRELVDYGYLVRHEGIYRVNRKAPERLGSTAQETAHLEDTWFTALAALE